MHVSRTSSPSPCPNEEGLPPRPPAHARQPFSRIEQVPVRSQLRVQDPWPTPEQALCVHEHNTDLVMYALPPDISAVKTSDLHTAQTRIVFAQCLAHQHHGNPKHEGCEEDLDCTQSLAATIEGLAHKPETPSASRATQLSQTATFLREALGAHARGRRIEGDGRFELGHLEFVAQDHLLSTMDERRYGRYAWFEPLGALASTADLSIDETLHLAQAYSQAALGRSLTDDERQAVLLHRYCLNLARALQAQHGEDAVALKRLREDADGLTGIVPPLNLELFFGPV